VKSLIVKNEKEHMTKKERVLAAINLQETDKVPKGEIYIESNIANKLLGKEYPLEYQHFQREKEVRELLHMDLVNLGEWPSEEIGKDENGNKLYRSVYGYEFKSSGLSSHLTKPPLDDITRCNEYKVPNIDMVTGNIVERFTNETDFFVFAQIGGPVSMANEMFGMQEYMMYCLTNFNEIRHIGEKIMEFEIAKAKLFIDKGAEAIIMTDDIAFNSGVFLPEETMEIIAYPLYEEAVKEIKKYRDVPVFFHSDGKMDIVFPRIVKCGFNGIHSLQPSAGMNIAQLKKDYGKDICLMGNIDLDHVMTFAKTDEVEKVVKETIDIAAPGGGFILATCNTLVDAIPPENALAMYNFAENYILRRK
jgi:uroporphyrinogen decarboxylase